MNDTEEEDLALYGEPVPDNTGPSGTVASPIKDELQPEKDKLETTKAEPAELDAQIFAKKDATDDDSANKTPDATLPSDLKAGQTPQLAEGSVAVPTAVPGSEKIADVPVPIKENGGSQPGGGSGGQDGDAGNGDASAEKEPHLSESGKPSEDGTGQKDEDEGSGEEGDEDDDDDDDDDEDEDSEDDDFDVILNYDEADTQAKPPSASFGSIGKVRLSSNKWQRPGYVPPERVIGVPTQGAARTGGVLSMLPTPTMQIGGSQKSVYDLEIGKLTEKPWLDRNADLSDYFNYGFNEETWKLYCERQKQMRLEASMLAKIKTVDGNKNQATPANRAAAPGSPKQIQGLAGARIPVGGAAANRGVQNKPQQQGNQPLPPPPPGMMPPPLGFEGPPGGMLPMPPGMEKVPNMPKMPGMPPNMPFPFPPGGPNPKGGNFQPPFPPFIPMPGGQRSGDGKSNAMFPMMPPGMPGLPPGMPMPPGGMPPGVGRGAGGTRGFPGELQTPKKLQQPQNKNGKGSGSGQVTPDPSHREEQKRPGPQGHQGSRFGNAQGAQSRQPQSNRPPHHDGDRRQRWEENRGTEDRRQSYDRQGNERDRGRGGHDDRGYGDRGGRGDRGDRGDRGYERRRWGDREDGYDRRRGGGHESQRYSDRRDYDRDRGRDYRKRSSSGRDYDEDRKRSRR